MGHQLAGSTEWWWSIRKPLPRGRRGCRRGPGRARSANTHGAWPRRRPAEPDHPRGRACDAPPPFGERDRTGPHPRVTDTKPAAGERGEAWSILLRHDGGRTVLIQGSAGYVEGALAGHSAEVAYLGVGQLGLQSEEYLTTYWAETVRTVGARRAVLTHWDDFFRPLDQPLRALPYAGDDLDVTMRVLGRLAKEGGVALSSRRCGGARIPGRVWRWGDGGLKGASSRVLRRHGVRTFDIA